MIFNIDIFPRKGYNKEENTKLVPVVHSLRDEKTVGLICKKGTMQFVRLSGEQSQNGDKYAEYYCA